MYYQSSVHLGCATPTQPYQGFLRQTNSLLHPTDANWDFVIGRWNSDTTPNILAIKKSGGESGTTEFHILNGHPGC